MRPAGRRQEFSSSFFASLNLLCFFIGHTHALAHGAPFPYLTRWRLQLGAQMLKSTSSSVARIAGGVGYESEPSFNRAFKREFGLPPARFRNQAKLARSKLARQVSTKNRPSAKR